MKKFQVVLLVLTLMFCFCGCTNYAKEYNKNTLVVKKNGTLVEVAIENFKGSSVKEEDLTSYVEEQITEYNETAGKKNVKEVSLDTEDMSKVKLVLKYKDMDSYNGFNSLKCTYADFSDVKESELTGSFKNAEGKSVKTSDITDAEKAKVLIISEKTNVVVNGEILYYNDEIKMKDDVVSASGDDNAIIIFK